MVPPNAPPVVSLCRIVYPRSSWRSPEETDIERRRGFGHTRVTLVGPWTVSTVGEIGLPVDMIRSNMSDRDPDWHKANKHLPDGEYMRAAVSRFGARGVYVPLGPDPAELYETAVFITGNIGDIILQPRYTSSKAASIGHMAACMVMSRIPASLMLSSSAQSDDSRDSSRLRLFHQYRRSASRLFDSIMRDSGAKDRRNADCSW